MREGKRYKRRNLVVIIFKLLKILDIESLSNLIIFGLGFLKMFGLLYYNKLIEIIIFILYKVK